MVATVRCEEIANEKLKELAENEVAAKLQCLTLDISL